MEISQVAARKDASSFFYYIALLPQKIILSLSLSDFFFLWGLMTTSRKGLLALLGEQLTPMMQGPVGNTQIACNLRERLLTRLCKLYRFCLKFPRKSSLCLLHGLFPLCVGSTSSSLPSTFFWVKTT
jgi:hypothetical protein